MPTPVGVFDSGIGGLTVLAAIRLRLPCEDLLYIADSLHAPYGDKPTAFIRERCLRLGRYLEANGAKALVVACNTATAAAVTALRATMDIPVIGIEPGLKPAASLSRSKTVGILATPSTLRSPRYRLLARHTGNGSTFIAQACPGLVDLIEQGRYRDAQTRELVQYFLDPLIAQGVDTIVLGCTHFPFITPLIQELTQGRVAVIETGEAVARHVENRLALCQLLTPQGQNGTTRILSTGPASREHNKIANVLQDLGIPDCMLQCDLNLDARNTTQEP